MRRPGVAVDAAVLASLVRIDRLRERDVGRIVAADDRARRHDPHRRLRRRRLARRRPPARGCPAVIDRLPLLAAEAVRRIERCAAAFGRCSHCRFPPPSSSRHSMPPAAPAMSARARVPSHALPALPYGGAIPHPRRLVPGPPPMTKPKTTHFDTLSLHAGAKPDPATGARATPIHLTASFVFPDSDHAAALFNMERAGHVYSRLSNPTCAVLEERIAALEGGVGAIATASGQAALHLAIATLLGAGGHIVASRALYGGSHNLLDYTLPRFGIDDHVRRPARHRRLARGDPAEHAAAVRRDARQSGPRRARRAARGRPRARARPAAARRFDVHHAVADAARSRTAPISSFTPRRNSCPATAS